MEGREDGGKEDGGKGGWREGRMERKPDDPLVVQVVQVLFKNPD